MERLLNKPIDSIDYHLTKYGDIYLIDEDIILFDLKARYSLIQTIEDIISEVKIIFEKEIQHWLFARLVQQYGNPRHYYDLKRFTERKMKGEFLEWNIKTWITVPYKNNVVDMQNNNIWQNNNFVIKLLNFSTIEGFDGDYTYLVYTRIKKSRI